MAHSVSCVRLQRIEEVKSRMSWTFPLGLFARQRLQFRLVSFTPEDIEAG
jgi:hypothetical protein